MHANIARYGIILNTERFEECVAFYRDLFGLPQLFEKDEDGFRFTCLEYGDGYLMIEQGGHAKDGVKSPQEGSFKLRFNVEDLEVALAEIRAWGIQAAINENAWGRTINISDPDGILVGVRTVKNIFVGFLPVQMVFSSVTGEDQFHSRSAFS